MPMVQSCSVSKSCVAWYRLKKEKKKKERKKERKREKKKREKNQTISSRLDTIYSATFYSSSLVTGSRDFARGVLANHVVSRARERDIVGERRRGRCARVNV